MADCFFRVKNGSRMKMWVNRMLFSLLALGLAVGGTANADSTAVSGELQAKIDKRVSEIAASKYWRIKKIPIRTAILEESPEGGEFLAKYSGNSLVCKDSEVRKELVQELRRQLQNRFALLWNLKFVDGKEPLASGISTNSICRLRYCITDAGVKKFPCALTIDEDGHTSFAYDHIATVKGKLLLLNPSLKESDSSQKAADNVNNLNPIQEMIDKALRTRELVREMDNTGVEWSFELEGNYLLPSSEGKSVPTKGDFLAAIRDMVEERSRAALKMEVGGEPFYTIFGERPKVAAIPDGRDPLADEVKRYWTSVADRVRKTLLEKPVTKVVAKYSPEMDEFLQRYSGDDPVLKDPAVRGELAREFQNQVRENYAAVLKLELIDEKSTTNSSDAASSGTKAGNGEIGGRLTYGIVRFVPSRTPVMATRGTEEKIVVASSSFSYVVKTELETKETSYSSSYNGQAEACSILDAELPHTWEQYNEACRVKAGEKAYGKELLLQAVRNAGDVLFNDAICGLIDEATRSVDR